MSQSSISEGSGVDSQSYYARKNFHEYWYKDQERTVLHRVDGPASISVNGSQEWFFEGKKHRVGAPARIFTNGIESWWHHGACHRIDGPARVAPGFALDDEVRWFLFGKNVGEETFLEFHTIIDECFPGEDIQSLPYGVLKELFSASMGISVK